jgi:hypothetical protein
VGIRLEVVRNRALFQRDGTQVGAVLEATLQWERSNVFGAGRLWEVRLFAQGRMDVLLLDVAHRFNRARIAPSPPAAAALAGRASLHCDRQGPVRNGALNLRWLPALSPPKKPRHGAFAVKRSRGRDPSRGCGANVTTRGALATADKSDYRPSKGCIMSAGWSEVGSRQTPPGKAAERGRACGRRTGDNVGPRLR